MRALLSRLPRRLTRRRFVMAAVICGSLVSLGGLTSAALFTATRSVPNNGFTLGTVAITANPSSAALTIAAMAPGDAVTGTLQVTNSGTLQERYSLTSVSDAADNNTLAAALTMTVKVGVTTCTSAGFAGSGTLLYSGPSGSTGGGRRIVGDPATGLQAGDTANGQTAQGGDRTLLPAASETLCIQVSSPAYLDNTYQGRSVVLSLTLSGEQTANNP